MKQPVKPPQKSPLSQHTPLFEQTDWLIVIILGILAVSLVISIISWQGDAIAMRSIGGRWFQSDGWRAFDNAVAMDSNQHRNQVRPLFSLIALPITQVLKQIASLSDIQAIWGLNSLCFALWVGMIFLTLRLIGISQLGAVFTSLLGLTSGAALFWFTVPETYPLSSLSIMLCLFLAAYETRQKQSRSLLRDLALILAGTFCLGTLLTNWMASLILNFTYRSVRRAIGLSLASLFLLTLGWGVQKVIFPQPAAFFLKVDLGSEQEYVFNEEQGNSLDVIHTAIVSSIVTPTIREYDQSIQPTGKRLTLQRSSVFNSGWGFAILASLWLAWLATGIYSLINTPHLRKFSFAILTILAGQLALHTVYGEETFLYALHFASPLIVIAGGSFSILLSRQVLIRSLIASLLIGLIAINNLNGLNTASTTVNINQPDERLLRLTDT